jgi:hypothetical protein
MIFIRPIAAVLFWAAFLVMLLFQGALFASAVVTGFLGGLAGYRRPGGSADKAAP